MRYYSKFFSIYRLYKMSSNLSFCSCAFCLPSASFSAPSFSCSCSNGEARKTIQDHNNYIIENKIYSNHKERNIFLNNLSKDGFEISKDTQFLKKDGLLFFSAMEYRRENIIFKTGLLYYEVKKINEFLNFNESINLSNINFFNDYGDLNLINNFQNLKLDENNLTYDINLSYEKENEILKTGSLCPCACKNKNLIFPYSCKYEEIKKDERKFNLIYYSSNFTLKEIHEEEEKKKCFSCWSCGLAITCNESNFLNNNRTDKDFLNVNEGFLCDECFKNTTDEELFEKGTSKDWREIINCYHCDELLEKPFKELKEDLIKEVNQYSVYTEQELRDKVLNNYSNDDSFKWCFCCAECKNENSLEECFEDDFTENNPSFECENCGDFHFESVENSYNFYLDDDDYLPLCSWCNDTNRQELEERMNSSRFEFLNIRCSVENCGSHINRINILYHKFYNEYLEDLEDDLREDERIKVENMIFDFFPHRCSNHTPIFYDEEEIIRKYRELTDENFLNCSICENQEVETFLRNDYSNISFCESCFFDSKLHEVKSTKSEKCNSINIYASFKQVKNKISKMSLNMNELKFFSINRINSFKSLITCKERENSFICAICYKDDEEYHPLENKFKYSNFCPHYFSYECLLKLNSNYKIDNLKYTDINFKCPYRCGNFEGFFRGC